MRVGINAQILSTSQSYHAAGSSRYLANLLRELRSIDGPEEIIAYLREGETTEELSATAHFSTRRTSWPTRRAAARIMWEQLALPRHLRADRVSLLHGAVNALPLAWREPCVVTLLDLTFLVMPTAFNRGNRAYQKAITRFSARKADRVITISESTRRDAVRLLGVNPAKVATIYCGVDSRFRPIDDGPTLTAFRERRGLPPRFILYLGTIEPRKNLVRLLDAYSVLVRRHATDWPLILAGGRGWGDEEILRHAAELDLGDKIRFVGFVPEEEIPLWYNAASLFVYPSLYEGFGLPPLEAMACATPVISSNRSSLPEVVGDSAILVDPTDTSAIADGIEQLVGDNSTLQRLAELGPRRAAPFTWRRMAEETLAVYRTVGARL